jgi:hypothetical protein
VPLLRNLEGKRLCYNRLGYYITWNLKGLLGSGHKIENDVFLQDRKFHFSQDHEAQGRLGVRLG